MNRRMNDDLSRAARFLERDILSERIRRFQQRINDTHT